MYCVQNVTSPKIYPLVWQQQLTHGHENQTWMGALVERQGMGVNNTYLTVTQAAEKTELSSPALSSPLWTAVTML